MLARAKYLQMAGSARQKDLVPTVALDPPNLVTSRSRSEKYQIPHLMSLPGQPTTRAHSTSSSFFRRRRAPASSKEKERILTTSRCHSGQRHVRAQIRGRFPKRGLPVKVDIKGSSLTTTKQKCRKSPPTIGAPMRPMPSRGETAPEKPETR